MDSADVVSFVTQAVEVGVMMMLPFLGASLITGVTVSLLQSVTQIQEQTLTFVPKLLMVLLVFVLALPWVLELMSGFMRDLYLSIPQITP